MSGCKTVAMANLEAQVRKKKDVFRHLFREKMYLTISFQVLSGDPASVLASSLAYLTGARSSPLYGGDLLAAASVMRSAAKAPTSAAAGGDREVAARQTLQNVFRAADHLLDAGTNRAAWLDLAPTARAAAATDLLLALEENAFRVARVVNDHDLILESSAILSEF